MINIYLKNQQNFFQETIDFYKSFANLVSENEADIIVINDFTPIVSNKIIACNSTGIEHIKAKEIISLQGENLFDLTAVPELCLAMSIYLTRIFKHEEIREKTLGLIGYGRIGKQFATYARNLGMWIRTYDENKNPFPNLDSLLKDSDIISLHITASEENRNWFTKEMFEQMKDDSIFLNSSRPWLVEEEGLKWALDNKLNSAWFDFEMPFDHPKLFITPHLGGTTKESKQKSEMIIAKKIKREYENT